MRTSGRITERVLSPLVKRLKTTEWRVSPFAGRQPRSSSTVHYVDPEIVAEIVHAGFIDGELHRASFKGVREDKLAEDVGREA
jgi:bifunctional non-homologous end joining protein LigD